MMKLQLEEEYSLLKVWSMCNILCDLDSFYFIFCHIYYLRYFLVSVIVLCVTLDCWSLHWGKTDWIQFTSMVWKRVWVSPSNLGPSSNSGPQDPLFQSLNIIVCSRLDPLFYIQLPLWSSTLSHFFRILRFWQNFSNDIAPMKYQRNTK